MPTGLFNAGTNNKTDAAMRGVAGYSAAQAGRIGHGRTLRALPTETQRLKQPQDGVPASRAKLTSIAARLSDVLQEAEDARLTGGTRSLTRRLLGLNVGLKKGRVVPTGMNEMTQAKVA